MPALVGGTGDGFGVIEPPLVAQLIARRLSILLAVEQPPVASDVVRALDLGSSGGVGLAEDCDALGLRGLRGRSRTSERGAT
jgi:hypothetical protein